METNIQYYDQMKESSYLSWFDTSLEGEVVTIQGYKGFDFKTTTGEVEKKWAVYFEEKEKGLILNKTNRNMLSKLFDGEVNLSIGQKVTLYYRDDIEFQGRLTKGVRLRSCPVVIKSISVEQEEVVS